MLTRICWMSGGMALLVAWSVPAHALTMHECSMKYKQTQSAGTLQGMNWNTFRKAECGSNAAAAGASATTTAAPASAVQVGRAVFPSAVSPKYANQTAGKARMHTCLDQYKANKASGGNSGLRWIEKGGGYYSACNRRLAGR